MNVNFNEQTMYMYALNIVVTYGESSRGILNQRCPRWMWAEVHNTSITALCLTVSRRHASLVSSTHPKRLATVSNAPITRQPSSMYGAPHQAILCLFPPPPLSSLSRFCSISSFMMHSALLILGSIGTMFCFLDASAFFLVPPMSGLELPLPMSPPRDILTGAGAAAAGAGKVAGVSRGLVFTSIAEKVSMATGASALTSGTYSAFLTVVFPPKLNDTFTGSRAPSSFSRFGNGASALGLPASAFSVAFLSPCKVRSSCRNSRH